MKLDDLNEVVEGTVTINIAGETVEVESEDNVKSTLRELLEDRSIDSFVIIVDGKEVVSLSELPETFAGHNIEVKRFMKGGL